MFGYVRPAVPELRVREHELYKAAYCGLCRGLGVRYGFAARCLLAYDLVFLELLLRRDAPKTAVRRCPLSLRRRRCLDCGDASPSATVILAYLKLRDDARDERFPKNLAARLALTALSGAYKKAKRDAPEFASRAENLLRELSEAECGGGPLDAAADKFALILSAAVPRSVADGEKRILETLLYHAGRWIYLTDAVDDFAEDARRGRFNILAAKLGAEYDRERVKLTLEASLAIARSSLELLTETEYSPVLRNILYLGLPNVQELVFAGRYSAKPRLRMTAERGG
ncbi:MAG: DUF5685 family protein [Oscillospiraceae bacterium]|jgi:hypothetical protein|nr:DUF5685 family protein [Oscillospiraceae bacterium]